MNDYNINATITADGSQFEQTLKNITGETKKFSLNMGSLGKSLAKTFVKGGVIMTGIHLVTKALKGMADQLKQGIKLYEDSAQKQKLLAQTLKVTGASAWTSAEKLNAMASSLQKVTNYTSDEITDLQTVLLGFKNITEENFEAATEAILDMATVMGMDLKSACQTVGKALDDPIKGLGSLSRQGFQFSEAEKQMLEDMVNVGDIAKAQDVILKELNTTYGGAAKAGAKATTQLKNSWGDLLKEMGRGVVLNIDVGPAIQKLQKVIDDFKTIVQENNDINEQAKKIEEAQKAMKAGTATDDQKILYYEEEIRLIDIELKQQEGLLKYESEREEAERKIAELEAERSRNSNQISFIQKVNKLQEELNKKMAEYDQNRQEEADLEATIAKLKQEHLEAIEEQKKQWELTEKITGQAVSDEEKLKFYQQDLIDIINEANGGISTQNQYYKDQMKIINDLMTAIANREKKENLSTEWSGKLRDQKIEQLEEERDLELANTELTEKEKLAITKKYNKQIAELEEEKLREQMQKEILAVQGYDNAAGEELRIREYYANEISKLRKKYDVQEGKQTKKKFRDIIKEYKKYAKTVISIMKTMASGIQEVMKTVSNIFSSSWSSMKRLFSMNIDDTLQKLLEFEDKILTFFTETLPQLPAFLASVLQSISVLIENLLNSIDRNVISSIVQQMIDLLIANLPGIIKNLLNLGSEIIGGLLDGITSRLPDIFNALYNIKDSIKGFLEENLPKLINFIGYTLKYGIPFLIDCMFDIADLVLANFPTVVQKVIDLLPTIVNAILEHLPKFLETDLPKLATGIVDLLPDFFKATGDLVSGIIKALPLIITSVINGLVNFLENLDADKIAEIVTSIINMVGDIASAIIESIGLIVTKLIPAMARLFIELIKKTPDILWGVVKGTVEGVGDLASDVWGGIKNAGEAVGDFFVDLFSGNLFASGTNAAPKGLAVVGEAGPELVRFNGGEKVYNNTDTRQMLSSAGRSASVFNVTFNNTQDTTAFAMMSQLKQYQRNLSFNGVL